MWMRSVFLRIWFGLLLGGMQCGAWALTFDVVGAGETQIPVAILPFSGESRHMQFITPVIRADLLRSGRFKVVDLTGATAADPSQLPYAELSRLGVQAVAVGEVTTDGDAVTARYRLLDVQQRIQLSGLALTNMRTQLRTIAHGIADDIYEKLTGERGVFSTRIAYILKQAQRYHLMVADADGSNAVAIFSQSEPIISPAWSPDGQEIAYVSFESKKPVVYVQTLATRAREIVANFKGSNSAPAWSPDGKYLAIALTRDGLSQIYGVPRTGNTGNPQRLSRSAGIDTEPQFSPDGKWIYFTSDQGGSPQIYKMAAQGGAATRITFNGTYNLSPNLSPDGRRMVFIQRTEGRFGVALYDFSTQQTQALTAPAMDESPTFAPDGRTILYATQAGSNGALALVSVDGRIHTRLFELNGSVRSPAWGPYRPR